MRTSPSCLSLLSGLRTLSNRHYLSSIIISRQYYRKFGRGVKPASQQKEGVFSVDRSRLYNPPLDLVESAIMANKEPQSALAKDLLSLIEWRGPISIHDYMALALHHSQHGYYHSSSEKIGNEGDFVTAPELSQVFGEMIGIWCYSVFIAMRKPSRINLVELGPGKGTLMQDILRVAKKFPDFKQCLQVQMVEASQSLRRSQQSALAITDIVKENEKVEDGKSFITQDNISINWNTYLHQVPKETPSIIIGKDNKLYCIY
jgi:hypothetical protein